VRSAIAHRPRRYRNFTLSDELRSRARIILDLRGRPADVLEKLASLVPQTEALNYLKSLISLLEQCFRVQSGQSPQHLPF